MIALYLWKIGSAVIFGLGGIHLFYTFFTDKFSSKNVKLVLEMKISNPILTKQTTIWKAWIGFNASHSSGAVFIGVLNFYLAFRYFSLLQTDSFYFLFNILMIGFYVWLAKNYWFKVPFIGTSLTLLCYTLSYILTLLQ
jgi:hypothetical protein